MKFLEKFLVINIKIQLMKLCIALVIKKEHYGEDLCGNRIWISPPEKQIDPIDIVSAKRIGIDYAKEYSDKLWRFYIKDNKYVSRRS
ncbi:hypothetical protein DRJ25_01720 [Candidatus Woesearchaeota archaeon]|nr:MAG: hypothetical protein DRJ25_01720 [Candidatus Woesearchaeota archaeon]